MKEMKDVISINDFSREKITEKIFVLADFLLEHENEEWVRSLAQGKVLANFFFESSTRTRLSFESAMYRLGGNVLGFSTPSGTSVDKGETVGDTIKMAEAYADIIVIRHPKHGAAKLAADLAKVPVINAGDGSHEHPTQTLLDLFTIQKELKRIDNLKIALVGDLRYGRTVHSLIQAFKLYCHDIKFRFISPPELMMPDEFKEGIVFEETNKLELEDVDVAYITRIQKERFDATEYERVKGIYLINKEVANAMKEKSIIMHPLPRVNEIHWETDVNPRAKYFIQASLGIPIRMALICLALGIDIKGGAR